MLLFLLLTCGGSDDGVYASCSEPDECAVPEGAQAQCIEKADEGFCTWSCGVDGDCDDGEDATDLVCASFESEDATYCFPSCEGEDTAEATCPTGFECRSTGGGSENRKVCFPSE